MSIKKDALIAFIIDESLSREKIGILTRSVNLLRRHIPIHVIRENPVTEEQVLKQIEAEKYQLVLAPLKSYLAWNRIEGFFGINRTQGPTFAGYFCEPEPFYKLHAPGSRPRCIVLDFLTLSPNELLTLIKSLLQDTLRSGIRPLLQSKTLIYCESWYGNQGQGTRADQVLLLPEIAGTAWIHRSSAICLLLSTFWTLAYDGAKNPTNNAPRAYFQIGADENFLFLRLFYHLSHHSPPKEVLKWFSPEPTAPTQASQLLLRYSDVLRVNILTETSDIEVVAGLSKTAPSETAFDHMKTIWVEPLSTRCVVELPYEAPSPQNPSLLALPSATFQPQALRMVPTANEGGHKKAYEDATTQIRELRRQVNEKEDMIKELKHGGVGTAPSLPPPDLESLLEAFQQRYFDARLQIRDLEVKIADLENRKVNPKEIENLRLKADALMNREKAWIKKLAEALEVYRKERMKGREKS